MIIRSHRKFRKKFDRLDANKQRKINEAITLFVHNPFDIRLRNHALHGQMNHRRSIKADYDLRIVFEEFENYTLVLFLDVGGHGEVY